uniref:Secreted protein n=1 Tax=Ascaris lumbricoides TaxID=6252 RepID=A0A0M3HSS1_ASCLU
MYQYTSKLLHRLVVEMIGRWPVSWLIGVTASIGHQGRLMASSSETSFWDDSHSSAARHHLFRNCWANQKR